jgi:hypothetical protein
MMTSESLQVSLAGTELIATPRLNKGTAFTNHERDVFELHGLLPPHVGSLDEQLDRRIRALAAQETPFNKYSFLRDRRRNAPRRLRCSPEPGDTGGSSAVCFFSWLSLGSFPYSSGRGGPSPPTTPT